MQEADEHALAIRKVRSEAAISAVAVAELTALRRQDAQHIAVLQAALREALDQQRSLAGLLATRRKGMATQPGPAQLAELVTRGADLDDPWAVTSDEEDGLLERLDLAERGSAGAALMLLTSPGAGRGRAVTPAALSRAASALASSPNTDGSFSPRLPSTLPNRAAASSAQTSGCISTTPLRNILEGHFVIPASGREGGKSSQPDASLSPDSSPGVGTTGDQENCPPAGFRSAGAGKPDAVQVCCHVLPVSCHGASFQHI